VSGDSFLASAVSYALRHALDALPLGMVCRLDEASLCLGGGSPDVVIIGHHDDDQLVCTAARRRWPHAAVIVLDSPATPIAPTPPCANGATQTPRVETIEHLISFLARDNRAEGRQHRSNRSFGAKTVGASGETPVDGYLCPLSDREWQVVEHLGDGLSNKEIARELSISLATVKNHVHHILEKLRAERRGQIVARIGAAKGTLPTQHD
jgi:DNA-binding NarL/FixJ family response regulator